ncbi:MAG TPA: helix-turn-helix transcriptional regulator [Bellilinea sp.]|jgi:DNA-binding NarL/FixJ family response regulator|nr:helix-turn-helix transcriptional regulator [Bellilinea sp.]
MDDKHLFKFYASLTARQQQVLQLVCEGLTNKEIAYRLGITSNVVAGHLTVLYEEWNAVDRMTQVYPNRYALLLIFAPFFARYPELKDNDLFATRGV